MDIEGKTARRAVFAMAIAVIGWAFDAPAQEKTDETKVTQSVFNTWFHCLYTSETRDFLKTKYEENREKLGADHPDTLASLEAFTNASAKLSDVKALLPNRELVFEKRKTLLGEDHPLTLLSMVLLADAYVTEGQFPRGLTLAQDALERFRRISGPDSIDTLALTRVVADYLGIAGELGKSREFVTATLARQVETLGETHPETLRTKLSLSRCLMADFEYKNALALCQAVHEEHLKQLGPKHPEAIESMVQLALTNAQQGEISSAVAIAGEANGYASRAFPAESEAMSLLSKIAVVLREAGFVLNAHLMLSKELELRTKHLGADHPKTILLRLELAKVRFIMGEREELRTDLEADLQKLRPMLASGDLRIWNSEITLANMAFRLGEPKALESLQVILEKSPAHTENAKLIQKAKREAFFAKYRTQDGDKKEDILPILKSSLEVIREKLGEDHPDTFAAHVDITRSIDSQGDHGKAIEQYEDLLRKMDAKIGRYHAVTINTLEYLAQAYEANRQIDRALRLLTQVGQARTQALGPNCPRTLRTYIEIARRYESIQRFDVAVNILEQVQERQKDRWPLDNKERIDTALLLADGYLQLGQGEQAIKVFKPVYEHLLKTKGPKDDQTLTFQGGLVEAHFVLGKKEEAIKELEALMVATHEAYVTQPLKLADALGRVGAELTKNGTGELAEKYLRESLALLESLGNEKWKAATTGVHLAKALTIQSKYDEAEKRLLETYELASKERATLPQEHVFLVALCANSLEDLYSKKGDSQSAAKWKAVFEEEVERSKPK